MTSPSGLIVYCRPGFESEAATELEQALNHRDCPGSCLPLAPGRLLWQPRRGSPQRTLPLDLWSNLIFTRQWALHLGSLEDLDTRDRIAPLLQSLPADLSVHELFLDTPDGNEGKSLSRLLKALQSRLMQGLRERGLWQADSPWRLHLLFISGQHVHFGISHRQHASPWSMGIPRLRLPSQAPSRSTLKLDEALQVMLDEQERQRLLRPGMRVVDLGAAPGGWTWHMLQRGMQVTAIDNGALAPAVLQAGRVEHLRQDGFQYTPRKKVDWLLCDMVEKPQNIARLVARWLEQDMTRAAIFNLKLPMKRRLDEVRTCLDIIRTGMSRTDEGMELRARQLYHDREEITVLLLPVRMSSTTRH